MTPAPRSLTTALACSLLTLWYGGQSADAQTSQLRDRIMERAREQREIPDAVRSRVGEELEGQSTEDLIRAAQETIRRSQESGTAATTITDTAEGASETAATAAPTATAAATGTPAPAATPAADTPPAPAASNSAPMVAQATPATTPPPIASGDIPAPIPLEPRYEKQKNSSSDVMEIESDESIMDNNKRLITFVGNVIVTEPRFNLTSDKLEVWMNDDTNLDGSSDSADSGAQAADKPPFKRAIATGGMVEIEKIGADGKVQIAKARKADYDAATGDIVLSGGPPTLQSGSGFVNPSSPDAVIILRADGNHQIKGGQGGRNKISIPLNRGSAPATSGPSPLSGSLEDITR